MYYLGQSTNNDCGKTCLRMLLAHIFKRKDYLTAPIKGNGTTFLELIKAATIYNVQLVGYRINSVKKIESSQYPFLARLCIGGAFHFVIVKQRYRSKLRIDDPDQGRYFLSLKEFEGYFTREILTLKTYGKDCLKKKRTKFDWHTFLPSFFLQIAEVVLLIPAVMLLKSGNNIWPVVAFSIAFGGVYLIERDQLVRHVFQKSYAISQYNFSQGKLSRTSYRDNLINIRQRLQTPFVIINTILACTIIVGISIINDPWQAYNQILVGIIAIISMIYSTDMKLILRMKKNETQLSSSLVSASFIKQLHQDGLKLIQHKIYRKIAWEIFLIGSVFIIMIIEQRVSLNYGVFYYLLLRYMVMLIHQLPFKNELLTLTNQCQA